VTGYDLSALEGLLRQAGKADLLVNPRQRGAVLAWTEGIAAAQPLWAGAVAQLKARYAAAPVSADTSPATPTGPRVKQRRRIPGVPDFGRAARSPRTDTAYLLGRRRYEQFCTEAGYDPHPADPEVVMGFIDWLWTQPGRLGRPISPATARLYVAGIRSYQRKMRDQDPTWPVLESAALTDHLKGYGAEYHDEGHRPVQAELFLAEDLVTVLHGLDRDTYRGRRDAAIFAVNFGGAARSAEVAGLTVLDVKERRGMVTAAFLRTKNKRDRSAMITPNNQDVHACPVVAVREYLADLHAHDKRGAVPFFGHMGHRSRDGSKWPAQWVALAPIGISNVVTRVCAELGLGHKTSHGLRAGAADEFSMVTGGDLLGLMDFGGWGSADVAKRYVRSGRQAAQQPMTEVYRRLAQGGT